jgi:hypothetical protein
VRGTFQPATTDTTAFAAECDDPAPPSCIPSDGVICLGGGRFQVEVAWLGFDDNTGIGRQVVIADGGPARSNDSGLFAFFEPNNWEMLVELDRERTGDRNRSVAQLETEGICGNRSPTCA